MVEQMNYKDDEYIRKYREYLEKRLNEISKNGSYNDIEKLKYELYNLEKNFNQNYIKNGVIFGEKLKEEYKKIEEFKLKKILNEIIDIIKQNRFSYKRKEKLCNQLREKCNEFKTYKYSYIWNERNNLTEIIVENPKSFIELSENFTWIKTLVLESFIDTRKINENNYEKILDVYFACNPNYKLNSFFAYDICLIEGIQNYKNWKKNDKKLLQDNFIKRMMKEGFYHLNQLELFLNNLNNNQKEEFIKNLKNEIKTNKTNSVVYNAIPFFDEFVRKELFNEIITINKETKNSSFIRDLLMFIYNNSPEVIKEQKDFFLSFLNNEPNSNEIENYFEIIKILQISGIEEINEYINKNKEKNIKQIVAKALNIDMNDIEKYKTEVWVVESIINELLEFQKLEYKGINSAMVPGNDFTVYEIGDYVIKLGKPRLVKDYNNPDVLQPLIRGQYGSIYIEVQPKVRTTNLEFEKIEEIRNRLKKNNISYDDLGENQFGVIDNPVKLFKMKNGNNLSHLNKNLDFLGPEISNGELTEDLYKVGKYYIIDTGCIQGEIEGNLEESEGKSR